MPVRLAQTSGNPTCFYIHNKISRYVVPKSVYLKVNHGYLRGRSVSVLYCDKLKRSKLPLSCLKTTAISCTGCATSLTLHYNIVLTLLQVVSPHRSSDAV